MFVANVGSCHKVLVVPFAALEQRFRVVCSGGTPHHSQHNNVQTRESMKLTEADSRFFDVADECMRF